jgi:hypothetical protein
LPDLRVFGDVPHGALDVVPHAPNAVFFARDSADIRVGQYQAGALRRFRSPLPVASARATYRTTAPNGVLIDAVEALRSAAPSDTTSGRLSSTGFGFEPDAPVIGASQHWSD